MIAVIAVLVVIALAVGGYFLFKGDDKKKTPGALGSNAPTVSIPAVSTPGPFPSDTGGSTVQPSETSSSGSGDWSDFAAFKGLIGEGPGTITLDKVGELTCELRGPDTGVTSYISCNTGSDATVGFEINVGQWESTDALADTVAKLVSNGQKKVKWTSEGTPYGEKVSYSGDNGVSIVTTFCALPLFSLEIGSFKGSEPAMTASELNEVWKDIDFPDGAYATAC